MAPELLGVASGPDVVLGVGNAGLAVGLLVIGAPRQRDLQSTLQGGSDPPLLALTTVVLVVAQA